MFALRSILHQVSDYEAILLYLQPPHWHLPGHLSLPAIAEFAHCLRKNLEIEQLRQSQNIEDVVTIIQKLCFPSEEYIEHVFTTLGPLRTTTEWTLNILAKRFWSIEAIELTGETRRLPIACQHGTFIGSRILCEANRESDELFQIGSKCFDIFIDVSDDQITEEHSYIG